MNKIFFTAIALAAFALNLNAQQLAFPGAVGFGAYATGGRAGTIYHVTNTNDSGAGSFRDAVSQPNRIIVFDVGGYINLLSAVSAKSSLTIAGQTAPGGGIGLMGAELSFYGQNNIICRHLRVRQGGSNTSQSGINLGASSSTSPASNMIFDHTSVAFGQWDSIDAVNTADFTVQYCIIADPINQQFGAHVEGSNASYVNNLWVNGHNRQPLAKADTVYINNVVYNYQAGYTTADTGGIFSHDIINNYFIAGPSTTSAGDDFYQFDTAQSVYASGNLLDSSKNGTLSGSSTAPGGDTVLSSPWSPVTTTIPTATTLSAYRIDVSSAGALPSDQVDQQVISTVTSLGTVGRIFDSVADSGLGNSGYGIISGGAAAVDSDGDGMPDYWEKAVGLNPNDSSDAMTIASDGYANIEHYLNWLANPHALTSTNASVAVDLWQYTGGFTNVSPVYSVKNASNGVVTLNSGHIAQFTATAGFYGLASFQFSVTASDGSAFTNTVSVLVQPTAPPTPTGLKATAGNALVVLGWNSSAGATRYPLERALSSGGPYSQIALVTGTGYTNTGLINGTAYFYSVAASNAFGVSAYCPYAGAIPTGSGLPSPWLTQDIGAVGTVGSATYTNGVFTVEGAGSGAWSTNDAFRFVYQTVNSNNCTIVGRIASLSSFQAGVMIRQSLAANDAYAHSKLHVSHPGRFEYRTAAGVTAILGGSTPTNIAAPYWFKVVRAGNTFTGYTSSNNVTWTQTATTNITMSNPVYVGLTTASNTTNSLSTATFDNVSVTSP